jgi:hypothetical protein
MKHKRTKIRTRLKIKQNVLGRTNRLLSFRYILSILYDTDGLENTATIISYIVVCAFFAVGNFYRTVVEEWPSLMAALFRLSGVEGDTQTAK